MFGDRISQSANDTEEIGFLGLRRANIIVK